MLSYKEFLAESEVITEATKKDVLAAMGAKDYGKNGAYSFAQDAVKSGLFKNDVSAMKAYNKTWAEFEKAGGFKKSTAPASAPKKQSSFDSKLSNAYQSDKLSKASSKYM